MAGRRLRFRLTIHASHSATNYLVCLKVAPPVVPHIGLMPWVAIEVYAKPGYGSLAKYHDLAGPWCG